MRRFLAVFIVVIAAAPAWSQGPAAAIVLGKRHAHATPHTYGCARTAGGNINVSQPSPNVVVITMSGAVAATGHPCKSSQASMNFDLNQEFKVVFANPNIAKTAKLYMETQVVGLLRSGKHCLHKCGGSAEHGQACASISCGPESLLSVCVAPHGVACCDNQSINCQEGPLWAPAAAACYNLHGAFNIQASHAKSLLPCGAATAEFAPGALDANWFAHKDAFHGADKSGFGFRITLRVVAD